MHVSYPDRRVSSEGLMLAVREHSAAGAGKPHVILVHGFPDQQDMWDRAIAELDPEQFHIVTYDVRGAGSSQAPPETIGYRTELLVSDLVAVIQATVPDSEPVHLVGHDWGSVQLWDAIAAERTDPRLQGRLASFTSVSGPSLDHVARLSRHSQGRRLAMLHQSLRSWYVYAFHLPVIPELLWSRPALLAKVAGTDHFPSSLSRNGTNGVNLYRANVVRRMRHPGTLRTDVPVQVVHPSRDKFIGEVMLDDLEAECSNLTVVRVEAGHWFPRTHPKEMSSLVTAHIRRNQAGSPTVEA